jgi:flagellar protein FliS
MFATSQRGINAYASVGLETGVAEADPHKLILMLYDGAMLALADARLGMQRQDTAAKGRALSKAITIIESGLCASLDVKAGGQLAQRLEALYRYMCDRLLRANLQNDSAIVEEVSHLLGELKGAWESIRPAAGNAAVKR